MKKIPLYIFFFSCCIIGQAQHRIDGVYSLDGTNQFIAIKCDSISFYYCNRDYEYYYGTFSVKGKELVPSKNLAWGHHCMLDSAKCKSNCIEFEIIEKYQNYGIGAPTIDTTIYKRKSKYVHVYSEIEGRHKDSQDSIVRFFRYDFTHGQKEDTFSISNGTGFYDILTLPVSFGTKYIIFYKHYLEGIVSRIDRYELKKRNTHFYYNRVSKTITVRINDGRKKKIKLKRVRDCNSCLGELLNIYPDY